MNNVIFVITRLEKPGKLVTYREIMAALVTQVKFGGRKKKGIKGREGGLKGKKKYIIVNRAVE